MATRNDIANLVFPDVHETIEDLFMKYPQRTESVVTRVAPSPTGFMHLGNFYTAFIANSFARQNKGIFFLRIEDTDQKRFTEGAVDLIVKTMRQYDLQIDEGPIGSDGADVGAYGPYTQSQRKSTYNVFAKHLIAQGLAYPCWMTEQEIESTRENQMKQKITPGIYGNFSLWRNKTADEIFAKMQEDKNFIIRFRSPGDLSKKVIFEDMCKGTISMGDSYNDIVLIKSDGLPTYHLAHIVDDTLMRTTHVVRGEERLTSVPLHLQLFAAFGFPAPKYGHLALLLKSEDGNKRKLSKRKDPEANMEYFDKEGIARNGVIEYLLTIIDPFFEERQKNNPDSDYHSYAIHFEKMSGAGALVDLVKLASVNNNYLSRISTQELYNQSLVWAKTYRPELAAYMERDIPYTLAALDMERHTEKDPKRFITFKDVEAQLMFFFDEERERMSKTVDLSVLPAEYADYTAFAKEYLEKFDLSGTSVERFEKFKALGRKYGFAGNNADFKEGGYIAKIGDLAMFLRLKLCCSAKTPDLFSVMKVLGKEKVAKRLLG